MLGLEGGGEGLAAAREYRGDSFGVRSTFWTLMTPLLFSARKAFISADICFNIFVKHLFGFKRSNEVGG